MVVYMARNTNNDYPYLPNNTLKDTSNQVKKIQCMVNIYQMNINKP